MVSLSSVAKSNLKKAAAQNDGTGSSKGRRGCTLGETEAKRKVNGVKIREKTNAGKL